MRLWRLCLKRYAYEIQDQFKEKIMEDRTGTSKTTVSKSVLESGKTVTVTVRLIEPEEEYWELSIEGKANQLTTWTEWFASADEAMEVGLSAILKEGIDEFYSDPEYLHSL
jgi:hypothetical protein